MPPCPADRRSHLAQAQGPRLRHPPPHPPASRGLAHERGRAGLMLRRKRTARRCCAVRVFRCCRESLRICWPSAKDEPNVAPQGSPQPFIPAKSSARSCKSSALRSTELARRLSSAAEPHHVRSSRARRVDHRATRRFASALVRHRPRSSGCNLQASYEIDVAVEQVGAEIKKLPTNYAAAVAIEHRDRRGVRVRLSS